MTPEKASSGPDRRGPEATGSIVKRFRKRDRQYTWGVRVRAYGQRHWIPLGTEREGWNDVRATDRRDEIIALVRRGVWRPPNAFELDPRERNPGFHEFSSDWLGRYRRTVKPRTSELAEYLLSHHVLPFLHEYRLAEIDYAVLSTFVSRKLERNEEIQQAREAGVVLRDHRGQPRRTLGPRAINMSLDVISKVLADAVKRGILQVNPAADAGLRLKVSQRRGNFLEADELLAIIEAAGRIDSRVSPETLARAEVSRRLRDGGRAWKEIAAELGVATSTAIWLAGRQRVEGEPSVRRSIVAVLGCAGLRNSEVCALDVSDLDFAHGVIHVRDSKTDAGVRQVNMTPWLRDELLAYRASRPDAEAGEPAFPTKSGARRDKDNINRRVIMPALVAANRLRAERGELPLPEPATAHTFRRTYITLMLEAGAPVPYVQGQVGHEDPTTTLKIYAHVLKRRDRRRHGQAFDALMSDAVPSGATIMMPSRIANSREADTREMPPFPSGSGHRNEQKDIL